VPVSILYICSHESGEPLGKILDERATVGDLKMYYQQYIKRHELGSNFLNNAIVTSVQKVPQSPKVDAVWSNLIPNINIHRITICFASVGI